MGIKVTFRFTSVQERAAAAHRRTFCPLACIVLDAITMNILICDDSPELREVLVVALQLQGHSVDQARTGAEALQKLDTSRFDAILLDVDMPEVSGWDIAADIRARAELNSVRIVMFSGRATEQDRARSLASGADAHVAKPATLEEIEFALAA